ncbi:RNA-directed DNA polymerase [Tanacetum coccineum]
METRGRKKVVGEPAPPARNPRDVETIESQWMSILLAEETLGKVHPDDFIDWLSTVQRVFDVRDIPDKLKVINEFDKLRMRRDVVKKEEQVVAWFLGVIKAKSKGSTSHFTSRFTPPTRTAPPTAPKTAPKATTPITSAAGNTRERVDNAPHCYKCSGLGHYARNCLNLKTLAFVPDDAGPFYDTNAEPELDKPGDKLVYPHRGKVLVIQRVLNVAVLKSVDDNPWLRKNIFRTKCTSKGKIYDMIIDRGSCENVFSISKSYKDKVWCEVIPMDVAHILLGCPWQFDRKTQHDGFQNTYNFKKDGVNITLVPFDSLVEENEIISEAPLHVQPLLREFADVIPDDIPPGLPAIRDIQHCINFIPDSAILNRPAYQMNPKEFTELQRQVTGVDIIRFGCDLEMNGRQLSKLKMDCTSGWLCPSDCLMRQNFSSIIAPLTECVKGGRFMWTSEASKAFDILKAKETEAPVLALPNFKEVFQVECDASRVGIGGVLSQNQRPIAFFNEKLNDARRKYSTYDKEFYAIVRSLVTWRHYFLSNEFVMFSDHEALKFINGQRMLKPHHANWVEFIQAFSFVIRHKVGSDNQVADALSPIILEGHAGGLASHFGRDKTLALLCEQFYWPKMERDVNRLLERCRTCHIAKTHSSNAGLYTPFSVPVAPWEDVSLDFVLGLPRTQRAKDSVMVARLYFAKIVKLHGVPKTLTSYRDVKFVSHFWRTLWTRLGSVNRTIGKSPFEVVYGRNPITPLDLVPVPKVGQLSEEGADQSEQIKELHRLVQEQIIRHNNQYKEHADKRRKQVLYREGDLVWIHLRKERFPTWHFGKLKPRGDDLLPYKGDSDNEPDSGLSLFQEGEDDADAITNISHKDKNKVKWRKSSMGMERA